MNIEEEFLKFIEFPEGSDGMYVTTASAKLFAKHCVEHLKQERDERDAEVIETAIKLYTHSIIREKGEYIHPSGLREYAKQLRQKAQEAE